MTPSDQLTRYDNWRHRLNVWYCKAQFTRFKWGHSDCLMSSANAVLAITGHDYAEPYRGKYSSEEEARKIMTEATGGGLYEFLHHIGGPSWQPSVMQTGDICCIQFMNTKKEPVTLAGVCMDERVFVPMPNGFPRLMRRDKINIRAAWRVG